MRKAIIVLLATLSLNSVVTAQPNKVYKSLNAIEDKDSVYVLVLRHKRLKAIPDEVFECKNLRKLDVGMNRIDSIPQSISALVNLEELNMQRNKLHSIPAAVGKLSNLRVLNLNRNPILELPPEMGDLKNLRQLILWCTGIVSVPQSFEALNYTLEVLDLRVCPLTWDDQKAIEAIIPSPRKRWDYVCNCK